MLNVDVPYYCTECSVIYYATWYDYDPMLVELELNGEVYTSTEGHVCPSCGQPLQSYFEDE